MLLLVLLLDHLTNGVELVLLGGLVRLPLNCEVLKIFELLVALLLLLLGRLLELLEGLLLIS